MDNIDVPHRFVGSGMYELPFGRGRRFGSKMPAIANALFDGWATGSIITIASGRPYNVISQGNPANTGSFGVVNRPNVTGDPYAFSRTVSQAFNTSVFVNNAQYQGGNAGRNILRQRGFFNWDFSVLKEFKPVEHLTAQFRFEAFHLTNTPRFGQAGNTRYDAMGFLRGQSWLQTPHLDSLARDGVNFRSAVVSTSLCSPSRASILTGKYADRHHVVDNNTAIPRGTRFFPQDLQHAGYRTAFIGKWHMGGESDDPQPGFDRWVSFKGQGSYLPTPDGLNIDGKRVSQKGYITNELTDYALDWLRGVKKDQPYFLYLSHKAVHADFVPPQEHAGQYRDKEFVYPKSMAKPAPEQHRPMWAQNQRNSWHGVEYPYHSDLNIADYYKKYAETLCGVDDSTGRVLGALRERGDLDSTLVVYMGDNGFAFGEHGLIDKRTAYEESMRVPLIARCPELFPRNSTVAQTVANIDLMPTFLEAAGTKNPAGLDGTSWLQLARGSTVPWRKSMLYEYY